MLIELEHRHDDWRAHEVDATDWDEAAYLAVRQSHDFLTDDNHTLEVGVCGDGVRSGSVVVLRRRAAELPSHATLRRMAETFGGLEAGGYWFACGWRVPYPRGTVAVDALGRRWVMDASSGGQWLCLTDPRETAWSVPGPALPGRRRDRGRDLRPDTPDQRVPWAFPGDFAEETDIRVAVVACTFLLHVLSDVEVGSCTPTQAATERLKCGLGKAGRDTLKWRTQNLLAALREAHDPTHVYDDHLVACRAILFDDARREVLRLAGIVDLVAAERETYRATVLARRTNRGRKVGVA